MKRPPASSYWTQEIESRGPASLDPQQRWEGEETARENSCRGATGADPGVFRTGFRAIGALLSACGLLLSLFFFLAMLAGCEFIYLPECDTQCQAVGGADAYGRPVQ